jgi:hypothetical protein
MFAPKAQMAYLGGAQTYSFADAEKLLLTFFSVHVIIQKKIFNLFLHVIVKKKSPPPPPPTFGANF